MPDWVELGKNLAVLICVVTAPYYEAVLLIYVQPFPLNYFAVCIPPGILAYIIYRRTKKRGKQLIQRLMSSRTYDMEKSLQDYEELLEKKQKKKET